MTSLKAWIVLAAVLLGGAAGAAESDGTLKPFLARYQAKYGSLTVGDSVLELKRDQQHGRWILESRADARGLARLLTGDTLVQTSWLETDGHHVRPMRFRFDDGMTRSNEDISLDFDWPEARVRGTAKGENVDLELLPNAQDPVSSQIDTMVRLLDGRNPEPFAMYDNHKKAKIYEWAYLGTERIETEAGAYDTVVYTNSRPGSDRATHMWLAPSLQYLAVQVESYRKGKRGFSMYLRKYRQGE